MVQRTCPDKITKLPTLINVCKKTCYLYYGYLIYIDVKRYQNLASLAIIFIYGIYRPVRSVEELSNTIMIPLNYYNFIIYYNIYISAKTRQYAYFRDCDIDIE